MAKNQGKTFKIEGAELIFKNFSGKEGQYNVAGNREFSVLLPDELAKQLEADDWNVKYLKAREEGDAERPIIPIAVNFKNRPPRVTMITSTGRVVLDEEGVDVLDWADIENIDLIARGYDWDVNGKQGTKAYLQTMFVTIEEDDLERKYAQYEEESS